MTEDPYRLEDDLHLSSIDSSLDDEYDGLETELDQQQKRGIKKMPIVLGMMLVVFVSGAAYIAYQMFVADVTPIAPAQPPMAVAQQQPAFPETDPMMPPQMDADQQQPQAIDGMPPMDGAVPPQDMNAGMPPVDGQEPAVTAEGLLPPAVDGAPVDPNIDMAANNDAMPPVDGMPVADAAAADLPPEQNFDQNNVAEQGDAAPAPVDAALPAVAANVALDVTPTSAADALPAGASVPSANDTAADNQETIPAIPTEAPAEVAQAPSEELLQPIDPVPAPMVTTAKETAKKSVAKATDTAKKTAAKADAKIDEVQKILESAGIEKAAAAPAVPAAPVEVTPRAKEVIVVTRSYGAQSPQAMIAAGDRVLEANQFGAAVDIYDNQLRNNPSDPLALAGKALALQKAGNAVEAMNTYERLISLNPRDVEAMTNYLGLLQEQDPQQALIRLQNLSSQYPQNAAIAGQLGMLHARMMDTPNAIRYFQSAAALDSTNATYPFNLAVLYDRLGSKVKARNEYRKALALARDYPSRAEIPLDVIRQRINALRS